MYLKRVSGAQDRSVCGARRGCRGAGSVQPPVGSRLLRAASEGLGKGLVISAPTFTRSSKPVVCLFQ